MSSGELNQEKILGSEEERFGPTVSPEHLADEDGIVVDHETFAPLDVGGALYLFDGAERLARRTRRSQNRLFTDALHEYLARHAPAPSHQVHESGNNGSRRGRGRVCSLVALPRLSVFSGLRGVTANVRDPFLS